MSPDLDRIADLERLISVIDEELAHAPAFPDWHNGDTFDQRDADRRAYHQAMDAIVERIVKGHGARFNPSAHGASTLRIAGIQSSCTSGTSGLLRNWQGAARRRIEKLKGGGK
ncbi:hypothetical protein [Rhizobium sp. CAU 1783]